MSYPAPILTEARRLECELDGMYFTRYFMKKRLGGKMIIGRHHELMQSALDRTMLPPTDPHFISRLIINVPPGYTKCSKYDTIVQTKKGGVMVQDVKVGDFIKCFKNGVLVFREIIWKEIFKKKCVEIKLLSGRNLSVSYDHPVLTQMGWVNAENLTDDHYLIRYCAEYDGSLCVPSFELDFITLMLFEGGCSNHRNPRFTSSDKEILDVFLKACSNLNIDVKKYKSSRSYDYNLLGGRSGTASKILDKYGINGKLATDKRLPKQFFELPLVQKYRFISLMVATDGFITKNHGQVCVTLGSSGLIDDIGLLLDSCGIPNYQYEQENGHAGAYTLVINPTHSKRLLGKVNFLQKQEKFEHVCKMRKKNGSLIFGYPQDVVKGLTYKCKHVRPRINLKYNKPITEYLFNRLKYEIDPSLSRFEMNDFIYDRVKSVFDIGTERVIHLSVDADSYDNKNYLANNLVVHNTELSAIHYMARGLALNPRNRFLHLSYSSDLALLNSSSTRSIVNSQEFQDMWPVQTKNDSNRKDMWWTEDNGGVRASSTLGQVTGFRAGHMNDDEFTGALVIDDPVKPKDADSDVSRKTVNDGYGDTISSRLAVETVPIIVIMQRVHYEDLSGFLLRGGSGEKWHHLNLPIIIEDGYKYPEENTHGIPIEHDLEPGWLWPYKHNETHERSLRAHRKKWHSQCMQAPKRKEEGTELWTDDLISAAKSLKAVGQPIRRLVSVDPAISNTDTSDEHGIMVGSKIAENLYRVEADYTCKGSPKTWAERAILAHEKHEADAIVIEINQGGDMCEDTLRNAGFKGRVIRVRASKGKTVRAEPIAALYEMGYVSHRLGLLSLEDEMIDFDPLTGKSNGVSPNRVDALVWLLTELSGGGIDFETLLKMSMGVQ